MADQQQQTISATFPAPPPFYKHFTKPNTTRLRQLRKEASSTSTKGDEADLDILALPAELRYLIPPPLPEEGKYRTFGSEINLNAPEQSLVEAGIEQLYPADATNPQPHLIALTRSLLSTFLSLVGILSQNATIEDEGGGVSVSERLESMQTILFNVHDLINRYRPHQARESLLEMMEERVRRMREETMHIEAARVRIAELMKGLMVQGQEEGKGGGVEEDRLVEKDHGDRDGWTKDERRLRRQRNAWAAIESEVEGLG